MPWHAPTGTSSRASSATSAARIAPTLSSCASATASSLIPYLPRGDVLALQRDSDALLLLIPEAGGRGRGVLSGKVFEYLAAERPIIAAVPPDGEAAALLRSTGAGLVAAPDDVDGLVDAMAELTARWRAGELDGTRLTDDDRERLSRRARAEELAGLLRGLG